jgi:spermidine synthase
VLLLGAVLLVAVCGFVYELVIVAMGTYLLGNSVEQVSLVLAAFVSSMGLGSLAAKPLLRFPLTAFLVVEVFIALLGGLSALALYAAFAWLDLYQPAMLVMAGGIGLLVGCEIPLLMGLLQRIRRAEAGQSVADLLAADYLGAVVAGVAFPLLLLPALGQIDAALAVGRPEPGGRRRGAVAPGPELSRARRRWLLAGLAGAAGVLGRRRAPGLVVRALRPPGALRRPDRPRRADPYQEVVVTESLRGGDVRLFLNGDLQFSSKDEARYHEALVHPAMAGPHARVLVLGGGDGLALREVLRHPGVREATQVELDPRMLELARTDPRLRRLNGAALEDPRVDLVRADAFAWLRTAPARAGAFDVVIADFPDPDDAALAKLYSVELYGLASRVLARGGRMVVQSGSPAFARRAYWSVGATMRAAGFSTTAYHVDVPSFGDWGFHLATADGGPPALDLQPPPGGLKTLDAASLAAAGTFAPDRRRPAGDLVSTLDRPRILQFAREGYQDY